MNYKDYDYESAYNIMIDNISEDEADRILKGGGKLYALKEIKSGDQLEIEIYPRWGKTEIPPEGRRMVKDNSKAKRNLNDKNAKKYVERLINCNFTNDDLWVTLTYTDEELPKDFKEAQKNMQNYIRRINRRRKKFGLANAKYIYITEYDPDNNNAEKRWHHHMIIEKGLDRDTIEDTWGHGRRNKAERLRRDEDGLTGIAKYITKQEYRAKGERRWNSSQGLKDPQIKRVHSKPRKAGQKNYKKIKKYVKEMVNNENTIKEQMEKWFPKYTFSRQKLQINQTNSGIYIRARMHERRRE